MRVARVPKHIQTALLAESSLRNESAGTVLFRRNQPGFGIFLVKSGKVSLRLEGADEKPLLDRTAGPGAVVGLPATLSRSRYSLTAVTAEPSKLAFVEREALLKAIRTNPVLGMELMRTLGEEIISMRRVLASPPVGISRPGRQ